MRAIYGNFIRYLGMFVKAFLWYSLLLTAFAQATAIFFRKNPLKVRFELRSRWRLRFATNILFQCKLPLLLLVLTFFRIFLPARQKLCIKCAALSLFWFFKPYTRNTCFSRVLGDYSRLKKCTFNELSSRAWLSFGKRGTLKILRTLYAVTFLLIFTFFFTFITAKSSWMSPCYSKVSCG